MIKREPGQGFDRGRFRRRAAAVSAFAAALRLAQGGESVFVVNSHLVSALRQVRVFLQGGRDGWVEERRVWVEESLNFVFVVVCVVVSVVIVVVFFFSLTSTRET